MNTIGLLGNIGSGKNTVAQYLASKGLSPFDAKELFDNSKLDILVVGDQYAEKI